MRHLKLILPRSGFLSDIDDQLSRNAIRALSIYLRHALHTRTLLRLHRDPLDRNLVSQALLEEMPLLSADPQISRYPVEVVW